MKSGQPGVLEINDWLAANLSKGQTVGVDAYLVSANEAKNMSTLLNKKDITVVACERNLVDIVWEKEGSKPLLPSGLTKIHDISVAGVEHSEKIKTVREFIKAANANALVISMLDEV